MNDALIEKLRKLLALSTSSFPHEAEAAMAKAQELAILNKIDLASITEADGDTDTATTIVSETVMFGQRLPTVNSYVSNILVNHFDVRIILTGGRERGRGVVFIGTTDAVQTAKYIYTYLSDTMVRCWKKYYDSTPGANLDHKQSYLNGFYRGLDGKLQANKIAVEVLTLTTIGSQTSYAVACVNNKEKIQSFIDEMFSNLRKSPTKTIKSDGNSYARGYADGDKCNIAKGAIT